MRTVRLLVCVVIVGIVLLGTVGTAVAAPVPRALVAQAVLSGQEEVPPVETRMRGVAVFRLAPKGDALHYRLTVANPTRLTTTAAHIHLGPPGVNGMIVAFLHGGPPTDAPVLNVEGTLTAANLVGPLAGRPLSALLDAMAAGNTYANVHTTAHPGGEARGQIRTEQVRVEPTIP